MKKAKVLIYIEKPGDPKEPFDIIETISHINGNESLLSFQNRRFVSIFTSGSVLPVQLSAVYLFQLAAHRCALNICRIIRNMLLKIRLCIPT